MEGQFIQVGNTVVNLWQVNFVEVAETSLVVYFSGGFQKEFKGAAAQQLRDALSGKRPPRLANA